MCDIIEVTDLDAPELDVYARLTQAQLRSRREPEKGIFIAESPKVIGHALDAGCVPLSLLMERRQLEGQGRGLVERCGQVPVYTGDRAVLAGLTVEEIGGLARRWSQLRRESDPGLNVTEEELENVKKNSGATRKSGCGGGC